MAFFDGKKTMPSSFKLWRNFYVCPGVELQNKVTANKRFGKLFVAHTYQRFLHAPNVNTLTLGN